MSTHDHISRPRKPRLTRLGRELAWQHLPQIGFINLHKASEWASWAAFEGERDGKRYAIAVMTRNFLQKCGKINGNYNLPTSDLQKPQLERLKNDPNVVPAFVCVSVCTETGRYSAHFGLVSAVGESGSVPMKPGDLASYEVLATNRSDPRIIPDLSNADR